MSGGGAAAATWLFRRRVAATPRLRRGYSVGTRRSRREISARPRVRHRHHDGDADHDPEHSVAEERPERARCHLGERVRRDLCGKSVAPTPTFAKLHPEGNSTRAATVERLAKTMRYDASSNIIITTMIASTAHQSDFGIVEAAIAWNDASSPDILRPTALKQCIVKMLRRPAPTRARRDKDHFRIIFAASDGWRRLLKGQSTARTSEYVFLPGAGNLHVAAAASPRPVCGRSAQRTYRSR